MARASRRVERLDMAGQYGPSGKGGGSVTLELVFRLNGEAGSSPAVADRALFLPPGP
jgi:hypothetical protein